MRKVTLALAVVAMGASAYGALPGDFPGGTNWVVHFDVERLMSSGLGDKVEERLAEPRIRKVLAAAELVFGMKLPDDVRSMTFAGCGRDREKAVAYFSGKFDVERLTTLASLAKDYHTVEHAGRAIHIWRDVCPVRGERTVHAAFAREGLIVMSEGLETLKDAIDALDGSSAGVDLSDRVDAEAFFTLVAMDLHKLPPREPGALMLSYVTDLEYSLRATDTEVLSSFCAEITDAETAEQILDVFEGLQALVELHPEGYPEVAALIKRVEFSMEGTTVSASGSAGIEQLVEIGENVRRVLRDLIGK
ncbi:MAG: hypothetical protein ACYS9X_07900 [Planctomycetota bacterium]|jgi:hypothetical protein